jgi:hypothetical protein
MSALQGKADILRNLRVWARLKSSSAILMSDSEPTADTSIGQRLGD